jgi:tetratricopeptide (TPR) repeat protein
LDLAEDLAFDYRADEAAAVMRVFDERFAGADLTPGQRARRADRHAVEVAGRGELAEAEAVWRTAERLFAEAGDDVGRQRVLARIGVALCETDRVEEGLPLLLAATDRLVADGPPARRATAVLRLAQAYLTLGQPDNALAAVERASALSPDPTPRDTAEVGVERLWVLRALGRLNEIQTDGPAVIELARASGAAPLIVRAHVVLASSHEMVGDPFTAGDLLTRAMEFAYDDDVARWLRQTRANILAETPRAAEVVDDLVEAVAERTAAGDAEGAARARHPLAIAYLTLGRLLDAAEVAEEELAALRDQDTDPTPVRYLLSTIYQGLGQPDEAIAQLEAIAATCVASGNRAGEAQMAQEVGDLLSRLDRDEQAAQRYQAAAALYHELGRPLDELANRRRHTISTFWGHGPTDAVTALAAADELAASLPDEHGPRLVWERATLSYDAARILWAAERPDEATDRIRRSVEGFRAIDAGGQAFAAETLQADLLLAGGDATGAEAAARRALAERPDDAEPDRPAALLAAALAAQDRATEAEAVRRQYGLADPDEDG